MAIATKTINPLHFEDLEPHRFEDLVRQLIYDYREWRSLEATGRQGSDDGFDVRGWEITGNYASSIDDENEIKEIEEDRGWLIQCKREKSISPKKLETYLNELNKGDTSELYGLIFVAACDFSKKTRDTFRAWCISHNLAEFHLWGKAELEDMLFQPKNDHLLFAYFGISIQIKKRSIKTKLRSILATKNQVIHKLDNHLEKHPIANIDFGYPILLRDPEAHEYPYSDKIKDFDKHPTWLICSFNGYYHSGLKFLIKSHDAYINEEGQWDYAESVINKVCWDDPWRSQEKIDLQEKTNSFYRTLPHQHRAILNVFGLIPYDDILAIDEYGDKDIKIPNAPCFENPHIYVSFGQKHSPFTGGVFQELNQQGKNINLDETKRISFFKEQSWNSPQS